MSQHPTQVTLRDENALLFLLLYGVKLHEIKVVGWMALTMFPTCVR
jgi:hypothetical protein